VANFWEEEGKGHLRDITSRHFQWTRSFSRACFVQTDYNECMLVMHRPSKEQRLSWLRNLLVRQHNQSIINLLYGTIILPWSSLYSNFLLPCTV